MVDLFRSDPDENCVLRGEILRAAMAEDVENGQRLLLLSLQLAPAPAPAPEAPAPVPTAGRAFSHILNNDIVFSHILLQTCL